ncbi:MAG: ATP-binding cassette domain-containing protein [Lactobacillaceae bacterium]|jgi:ABC-2 type transport system ATP-binding protein|nr:ATP-binding cassette domain-containing protein [Lactobacillaceae bacterium]
MIEISNLGVSFNKLNVLNNVNYSFLENEFYLIKARNGSGKSTLLNAIFGLVPFTGKIYASVPQRNVFYLPNDFEFDSTMTGIDYLEYIKFIWKSDVVIDHVVTELNMTEYIKRRVSSYSLGMHKMLTLALYLVSDTKYWLIDELNNGLDEVNLEKLILILTSEMSKKNKLIIFVTHQPDDLALIESKLLTLRGGELIEQD